MDILIFFTLLYKFFENNLLLNILNIAIDKSLFLYSMVLKFNIIDI